jgi:ribosomal protein S18 acetylase RimI-like enzyme
VALQVWPHNERAIALYRKFGFQVEGRLVRHYRRRNGELWDAIPMALVLDTTSPGSPFADVTDGLLSLGARDAALGARAPGRGVRRRR